jgi:beta-lactam-binding protein with PASTA domain
MSLQSDPIVRECPTCGHPDQQQRDFCASCGEYLRWELTEERSVPAAPPRPEPVTAVQPVVEAPVPVLLHLHATTVSAAPGAQAALAGTIRNQSGLVDNYDFRVSGLPADWVTPPPTAYLLPFGSGDGHEQTFELALLPPRAPEAEARAWPFVLEAVSRSTGQVAARADATLVIEPFHTLEARARPQRRRGRVRASFEIEIRNGGNADATVAMTAADSDDACTIRLDPPAVRVAPGGRATARLRVRPHRTLWWGRPVEHRIDLQATSSESRTPVPAPPQLAFRQLSWIPWWVPPLVLALVALAIAFLALRGERIVVPEVRGQTAVQAQQTLVDAGLESTPRIEEQVVADAGQVGRVIAQNPAAGSEIDADGAAILQAGVANQVVGVPDVRGATRDQAQQLLAAAGLTLGAIEPADAPPDALVDFQNPAAGGSARLGSPVDVILVEQEAPDAEEQVEEPAPEEVAPEAPEVEVPEAPR